MSYIKSYRLLSLVWLLGCLLAPLSAAQATVMTDFSRVSRVPAAQAMLSTHGVAHFGQGSRAGAAARGVSSNTNEPNPFVLLGLAIVPIAGLRRCQTTK